MFRKYLNSSQENAERLPVRPLGGFDDSPGRLGTYCTSITMSCYPQKFIVGNEKPKYSYSGSSADGGGASVGL